MKFTSIFGVAAILAVTGLNGPALEARAAETKTATGEESQQERSRRVARGAQYWAQHCKRCHNLRNGAELTDDEWEVAVTHMQVRANLPGQIAKDVKVYLKSSN